MPLSSSLLWNILFSTESQSWNQAVCDVKYLPSLSHHRIHAIEAKGNVSPQDKFWNLTTGIQKLVAGMLTAIGTSDLIRAIDAVMSSEGGRSTIQRTEPLGPLQAFAVTY